MNFSEIAIKRQSCRSFDSTREVEEEKLLRILEIARLSPSACNGQPYHITVCLGECAKNVAKACQRMGMNKFASDAPVMMVVSEKPYVPTAALGAKVKKNDYRSMDIGILSASICFEAEAGGLGSCMLGWFEGEDIKRICSLDGEPRLVIAIGYAKPDDKQREKKRKDLSELVTFIKE